MKLTQNDLMLLDRCKAEGNRLFITQQLDRKEYVQLNQILEACGGKWVKKEKAHIFPSDAQELIDSIIESGEIKTKQEFLKETNFFETPKALAETLVHLAEVKADDTVLEPSAGRGAIAKAIRAVGARVLCIEKHEPFAKELGEMFGSDNVTWRDFLVTESTYPVDKVVMNPPFRNSQDIKHVRHAYDFLKTGGILVSVMGASVKFRETKDHVEFREWLASVGGTIEDLPSESFRESGTLVGTVVVKIKKV